MVPAKACRGNEIRIKGRWRVVKTRDIRPKHCCSIFNLESLISTGKVRIHRTRDWRIPPGEPRFALKKLYSQLDAMQAGKNICQLTDEEFIQGIFELGSGQSSVR